MEQTISRLKKNKATNSLSAAWEQIDELLAACEQVMTETKQIFSGSTSKNGSVLENHATNTVELLNACQTNIVHAITLVYQVPVTRMHGRN